MVTLTFAFSIFGTAMFKEMKIVLEKTVQVYVGTDLYVITLTTPYLTFLDQPSLTTFLDSQSEYVENYSFVTPSTRSVIHTVWGNWDQKLGSASEFSSHKINLYGVPEKYLDTVNN
jgi:hypothetical protein